MKSIVIKNFKGEKLIRVWQKNGAYYSETRQGLAPMLIEIRSDEGEKIVISTAKENER